jgi:hypothetical protein
MQTSVHKRLIAAAVMSRVSANHSVVRTTTATEMPCTVWATLVATAPLSIYVHEMYELAQILTMHYQETLCASSLHSSTCTHVLIQVQSHFTAVVIRNA